MYTFLSITIIIVCLFMIAAVLMQNSKGGGLTQSFASQQQIMGVRKTTEFLEKVTWTLAVSIVALSFLSVAFMDKGVAMTNSAVDNVLNSQQTTVPAPAPAFGTQATEAPAVETAPATEAPAAE
jgi:preprotein translocase subunit SecG